jgi:hypothetical protein
MPRTDGYFKNQRIAHTGVFHGIKGTLGMYKIAAETHR